MSKFRSETYDAAKDSGTSAGVPTDLNPGRAYNVDLRYLRPQERGVVGAASKGAMARVDRFMKSARAAGKYLDLWEDYGIWLVLVLTLSILVADFARVTTIEKQLSNSFVCVHTIE